VNEWKPLLRGVASSSLLDTDRAPANPAAPATPSDAVTPAAAAADATDTAATSSEPDPRWWGRNRNHGHNMTPSTSSARRDAAADGPSRPHKKSFTGRMRAALKARDLAKVAAVFDELCEAHPEDPGSEVGRRAGSLSIFPFEIF